MSLHVAEEMRPRLTAGRTNCVNSVCSVPSFFQFIFFYNGDPSHTSASRLPWGLREAGSWEGLGVTGREDD